MATYNSTGSLMLPTKKRKADGTIVDADKAFNDYVSTLPENQRDSKNFNVRRYWELNGRPANFDEAVNRGMFTMNDEDKMWHAGTVAYNQAADEYEFMKSPDHPTIGMEVDAYNNSPEMAEFRQNYYLDQSTTPWKYRRREGTGGGGNTVDRHQRTGVTTDGGNTVATQQTDPQLDSYDRMLEYLRANQIADADADKRARKRELMAAIGDGISAVSSLYQTTKGAPVTYNPQADMSKVMRDRYDRMIAQRKADSDKYLNYLKVQAAKEQNEATKAYRLQQLADTKEYRDALVDQGRERTEAYILNKKLSAAGEVAFNAAYNQEIEKGASEDDALAAANIAKDQAIADAFNAQVAKDEQVAADKHAESQKKQDNIQARTDKTKATPAKSSGKSKGKSSGNGGNKKSSTNKPKMY